MDFRNFVQTSVALLVFASAYALIRIALTELPPLTLAALRFILASSLIVPLTLLRYRGNSEGVSKKDIPILLGLSISQIFMPNLLQNIGLEYTTASVSSVLQSTTPVFTLLLSSTFLKENVRGREIFGVVIGMMGVVLLSSGGNLTNLGGSQFVGNMLQVGVAASYAVSGIVGKVLLKKYQPMRIVTLTFVFGGGLLTFLAVAFERNEWPVALSNQVILALVLLSFLYCVGLVFWYNMLQKTRVFQLYALLLIMPILAVIISVVVLSEQFTLLDVAFSGMTLVGVAITQSGRPQ